MCSNVFTSSIAVKTSAHRTEIRSVCGPSRARNLIKMLTALFSSRSMTSPHSTQQYVRFQSGIACRCPHPEHILLVLRSSKNWRFFPYSWHSYGQQRDYSLHCHSQTVRDSFPSYGFSVYGHL